jgi:hypothetical protein
VNSATDVPIDHPVFAVTTLRSLTQPSRAILRLTPREGRSLAASANAAPGID